MPAHTSHLCARPSLLCVQCCRGIPLQQPCYTHHGRVHAFLPWLMFPGVGSNGGSGGGGGVFLEMREEEVHMIAFLIQYGSSTFFMVASWEVKRPYAIFTMRCAYSHELNMIAACFWWQNALPTGDCEGRHPKGGGALQDDVQTRWARSPSTNCSTWYLQHDACASIHTWAAEMHCMLSQPASQLNLAHTAYDVSVAHWPNGVLCHRHVIAAVCCVFWPGQIGA